MADIILPSDIDVALAADLDVSLAADVDIVTTPIVKHVVNGVHFDGTNDFLSKITPLTGVVASKLWTASVWVKSHAAATNHTIHMGRLVNTAKVAMRILSNNNFFIQGDKGTGTVPDTILRMDAPGFLDTTSWHNVLWSVDMSDSGKARLLFDGVDALNLITHLDFEINFAVDNTGIGAFANGAIKANVDMADFWSFPGVYTDFDIAANVEKFIDAGGRPVNLEATTPVKGVILLKKSFVPSKWTPLTTCFAGGRC